MPKTAQKLQLHADPELLRAAEKAANRIRTLKKPTGRQIRQIYREFQAEINSSTR